MFNSTINWNLKKEELFDPNLKVQNKKINFFNFILTNFISPDINLCVSEVWIRSIKFILTIFRSYNVTIKCKRRNYSYVLKRARWFLSIRCEDKNLFITFIWNKSGNLVNVWFNNKKIFNFNLKREKIKSFFYLFSYKVGKSFSNDTCKEVDIWTLVWINNFLNTNTVDKYSLRLRTNFYQQTQAILAKILARRFTYYVYNTCMTINIEWTWTLNILIL